MTEVKQGAYDAILTKIRSNYENVSLQEYKQLIEFICSRYSGGDIILDTFTSKQMKINFDYLSRAYFESVHYKSMWGSGSRHYILSNIYKASHGLSSDSRKQIFREKELVLEDSNIGFGNRTGFVQFKFFTSNDVPYLFIIHEYGHNSITNKVEDVVSTIENQFLQDIGFGIIEDSVQIFYKDIYDDYNQVELEAGIKKPQWRSLDATEQAWFDQTWDWIENRSDSEPEQQTQFFEKGRQFDAHKSIRSIIQSATRELYVVDNYIDSSVLIMLDDLTNPSVHITLLTSVHNMKGETSISTEKLMKQRGNFELKNVKDFHDRYLISDNQCFLLGASIKDFANKVTTLVPIHDGPIKEAIKKYIQSF